MPPQNNVDTSGVLGGAGFSLANQAFDGSPLTQSTASDAPSDVLSGLHYVPPVSQDQRAQAQALAEIPKAKAELDYYNQHPIPNLHVFTAETPDVPHIAFPTLPVHEAPHSNPVSSALSMLFGAVAPQYAGQMLAAPYVGAQEAADRNNAANLQHYQLGTQQALAQNQNDMQGYEAQVRNNILNAEAQNMGAKVDLSNALARQNTLAGLTGSMAGSQALGGNLLDPLIEQDKAAGLSNFERELAIARYNNELQRAKMDNDWNKTLAIVAGRGNVAQIGADSREQVGAGHDQARLSGIDAQQAGLNQRWADRNNTLLQMNQNTVAGRIKVNNDKINAMLQKGSNVKDPVLASQLSVYGGVLRSSQNGLVGATKAAQAEAEKAAMFAPDGQKEAAAKQAYDAYMAPFLQRVDAAKAAYQSILDRASQSKPTTSTGLPQKQGASAPVQLPPGMSNVRVGGK
jgi:hypothetical protein